MDDRSNLIFCLWGCLFFLGGMLWWTWRRGTITAGLPLCYLFSLSMIHFVGAGVNILPWNQSSDTHFVAVGFRECFFGVASFVCGVLAFNWIRKGKIREARLKAETQSRLHLQNRLILRLPQVYVVLGLLFIGVFIPVLSHIPSIGAAANSGAYLMVGGCCLSCWRHWQLDERGWMIAWLAATLIFPLFTMLTMGFIGSGVSAALIVLTFCLCFYRPRWLSLLILGLLLYLGLTVFVSYMRDRNNFRDVVWAGESISQNFSARVDELWKMFSQFEWFDWHNDQHLEQIEGRLNQNYLVGAAVVNLNESSVPYADGRTIGDAMMAMIPRILWPGKPERAGSPQIVSHYTGMEFDENTSVGIGQVMEFYINFGRWGIILGFFCFGWIVRWMDWRAAGCLRAGDWLGFMQWFLPALAFLQTGGSLIEVTGTFASSMVLVIAVNWFLEWFYIQPESRLRPRRRRPTPPATEAIANAESGGQAGVVAPNPGILKAETEGGR